MRVLQAPDCEYASRAAWRRSSGRTASESWKVRAACWSLTRAPRRLRSAETPRADSTLSEVVVTASRYAWVRVPQTSLTRLSDAELHLAPNVGDDPLRTLARLPGAAASDLQREIERARRRRPTKPWCASTACA